MSRSSATAIVLGTLLAATTGSAAGQEFPSRPLTVVVPFPAGGGSDLFGRLIGQRLSVAFGRTVVVDNRAGASGNIGAEAVARAAPDGHTLLYTAATIALAQALGARTAFDPLRDLAPVSMSVTIPQVLVTHPSLPVRTVRELVAIGKRQPGSLTYSSGSVGSAGHLATELLVLKTGLDARNIPYRGAAPALTALISGETQFSFLVTPLVQGHLKTGKLRALAISSRTRSAVAPGVPTLIEAGVADYEALQWHGLFAPAKTPLPVIDRLHREFVKALAEPEMKDRALAEGADLVGSSPAEFTRYFRAEVEKWTDVARRTGARAE